MARWRALQYRRRSRRLHHQRSDCSRRRMWQRASHRRAWCRAPMHARNALCGQPICASGTTVRILLIIRRVLWGAKNVSARPAMSDASSRMACRGSRARCSRPRHCRRLFRSGPSRALRPPMCTPRLIRPPGRPARHYPIRADNGTRPEAVQRENHAGLCRGFRGSRIDIRHGRSAARRARSRRAI